MSSLSYYSTCSIVKLLKKRNPNVDLTIIKYVHQCARTQRLYNPVYSVPAILLFGVIFFSLPVVAKGNGKIMKQGPVETSRGSNVGYSRTCRKADSEDKNGY